MKRFSEQFKKEAERVTLRTSESHDLRERVVAYMEYHPLPAEMRTVHTIVADEMLSPVRSMFFVWSKFVGAAAVLLLVIIPAAAEKALPGDVLYPVKVRFNEEVRSSLSFSTYSKVEWETERLERRLAEVRLLASEGKLTDDVGAAAAVAVAEHAAAAAQEIETMRENDDEGAAVAELAFATALEAQTDALETTISRAGVDVSAAGGVTAALSNAQAAAQADEQKPSFERLLGLVEQKTTDAQELFASLKPIAGETAKADIERRLQDIERKREEAVALATAPEENDEGGDTTVSSTTPAYDQTKARALLKEILQATEKLTLFMSDIDLSTHVSVEDLVPVEPTEEELQTILTQVQGDLDTQVKALKVRAGDEPNDGVVHGLTTIEQKMASSSEAVAGGDYEAAIVFTREAYALASDILRAFDVEEDEQPATDEEVDSEKPEDTSANSSPEASTATGASSTMATEVTDVRA